jgi:hypothetical protein
LSQTKPEAYRVFIDEIRGGERRQYWYGFFIYVLGVITPLGIHFLFTKTFF